MIAVIQIGRAEKGIDQVDGKACANHALAEAENVGVVVLTRQSRGKGVRAAGGANAAVLVGGDGHADAGSADQEAEIGFFILERFTDLLRVDRIITAVRRVRADVGHRVAVFFQMRNDLFFNSTAA